jgi:hypothetical protein
MRHAELGLGSKRVDEESLKVSKREFDAVLGKLIATPPTPVTPPRKKPAKRKPAR